jgi:hypothetical protein
MNNLKWRVPKYELPSLILISVVHIWGCFNFPAYIRLGFPWSNIVIMGASILGVLGHIYIFSNPGKFVSYVRFDLIDETLWGTTLKKIIQGSTAAIWITSLLIIWYKDFFRMPHMCYILLYFYYILFFILLFRAAKRSHVL